MIVFGLFVLGTAMGSFSLALAHRLRFKMDWVKGRSVCEHCGHVLTAADLIPIVSWIFLRGRCRYCKKSLSTSLPLSELGLGAVFATSYLFWPYELSGFGWSAYFALWLLICMIFSALFWYDLAWMILPNKLVYPLIGLSIADFCLHGVLKGGLSLADFGWVAFSIAVSSGLFLFFYVVSKGKWIGFGDVRMGVALGFLAAKPEYAALIIFTASFIGSFIVLPAVFLIKQKLIAKLPFGPLLIVAAIIIRLFGRQLLDLYVSWVNP